MGNCDRRLLRAIISQLINTRRVIAVICIAVIVVTGMMPAGAVLLRGVLVPLGPLFGTIVAVPIPSIVNAALPTAPVIPSLASRAPPLV